MFLIGKSISAIITAIFFVFKKILKIIFYRPLLKTYYAIFRLKRNELGGQSFKVFLKKESGGFILIIIGIVLIVTNLLTSNGGIKTANAQLSKTAAASLIADDFDTTIEEELIQENLTPAIIANAKLLSENYSEQFFEKDYIINNENQELTNNLTLNQDNDLIFKPLSSTNIVTIDGNIQSSTNTNRTETEEYIVQSGDTISTIAAHYSITINTILWANNLGNYSIIKPGQKLIILPYSGLLYTVKSGDNLSVIASKYDIDNKDIIEKNNLSSSAGLKIGQKLILPGASRINTYVAPKTTSSNTSYSNTTISTTNKVANSTAVDSDSMVWPTEGHRITQYFTWSHNGLDIANSVGTPIYAADAGTVEISTGGWNGGYGNTILLNHGNGVKTRYGHLSALYVKKGDVVAKGENIGAMGSTGNSTGPHIHFEVVINGTRYNPLNYIKY